MPFALAGLFCFSALCFPAGKALAETTGLPTSGQDLADIISACDHDGVPERTPGEEPSEYRSCYGYQAGVVTGAMAYAQASGGPMPFCLSPGTTDEEIFTAIDVFIKSSSARLNLPASAVVLDALRTGFPCRSETLFPDADPKPAIPSPTPSSNP